MIVILKQFWYTLAIVLLHLMEYNGTGINSDHDFSMLFIFCFKEKGRLAAKADVFLFGRLFKLPK